jgi:hypothetical protein
MGRRTLQTLWRAGTRPVRGDLAETARLPIEPLRRADLRNKNIEVKAFGMKRAASGDILQRINDIIRIGIIILMISLMNGIMYL